jgi:carbamate kinase
VEATGNEAIITQPKDILTAVAGKAGTRIVKDTPK